MIFVSLYALASTVGFVVDLVHHQWVPMLCVLTYSALAYRAGEDLALCFRVKGFDRKVGRALMGILFAGIALYLSHHPLNLVYTVVQGSVWVLVGMLVGIISIFPLSKT